MTEKINIEVEVGCFEWAVQQMLRGRQVVRADRSSSGAIEIAQHDDGFALRYVDTKHRAELNDIDIGSRWTLHHPAQMNFLEALEKAREGKRIRRIAWDELPDDCYVADGFFVAAVSVVSKLDDMLADDWIVVDE